MDKPASKPPVVSSTLASDSRSETNSGRCAGATVASCAASTCGMPEPAAPGAHLKVSQATPALTRGVHSIGAQNQRVCNAKKKFSAASASQVSDSTANAASTAKEMTTMRAAQRRQSESSWRAESVIQGALSWGG